MPSVISVSRDTVVPCELGAPPLSKVETCVSPGTPPLLRAVARTDSNETPFERNEGVLTLAMLLARASPRWGTPSTAYCVACMVTSAMPSNLMPPHAHKKKRGKRARAPSLVDRHPWFDCVESS